MFILNVNCASWFGHVYLTICGRASKQVGDHLSVSMAMSGALFAL
ncbi:MAG: hypothetical protein WCK11_02535 [Candidatus Falkowbacteria bacterium]